MEKNIISENLIKEAVDRVLFEQMSKVSRQDFSRVQFKIEELQNSLGETVKELRKLEDSVPSGLKSTSNARISGISVNLSNAQKLLTQLKDKVRQYKKSVYSQSLDEKKK
jgi:ElaB/YqjD/DUF883 family membrane-anchored ribosome-binding protein